MSEAQSTRHVDFRIGRAIPTNMLSALVFAVVIACIVNGLSLRIVGNIRNEGIVGAIGSTFGISIIVWFSIYNCMSLLCGADLGKPTVRDTMAILVAIVGFCFPLPSAAWAGLSILSVHFLLKGSTDERARRAFWVTLALSGSLQWARWFSAIFMPTILEIDSVLIATLSGFPRYGNLVTASDGTTLQILEACSSFLNVSLAFLAWINARSYFGTRGLRRGAAFLAVMVASVVLINTIRISLIAFRPDQYELIHGPIGALVANITTTLVVVLFSIVGARK